MLTASGKHIVPTERGLALFGVLQKSDQALVDPAVTAKLEFLLDEVLFGRRRAEEAIDAVCRQAARIIERLLAVPGSGVTRLPAASPKFSPAERGTGKRQRRTSRNSGSPKPERSRRSGNPVTWARPAGPAATPDSSAPAHKPFVEKLSKAKGRATSPHGAFGNEENHRTSGAADGTPLRIPFGNKEMALRLGARYRTGGWFAPPGINLKPFREKGWL
jgi:DNA topoisomerase-3